MTIPPDCSAVHMLMMGAMPMVVPWKYTPLKERNKMVSPQFRARPTDSCQCCLHYKKEEGRVGNAGAAWLL